MNVWTILGRLGHDPRVRSLPNGDPVLNLSVAVERDRKDKDGNKMQPVWVDVTSFGRRGMAVADYLCKGSRVGASGSFNLREYTDKNGVARTQVELVADRIWLVDSKEEREGLIARNAGSGGAQRAPQQPAYGTRPGTNSFGGTHRDGLAPGARPAAQGSFGGAAEGYQYGPDAEDDIPF